MFRTLNVNARAIVRVSQAVARNMIDAGIKGSIVNISSTISTVSRTLNVVKKKRVHVNIKLYAIFALHSFVSMFNGEKKHYPIKPDILYNAIVLNFIFREPFLITRLIVHLKEL